MSNETFSTRLDKKLTLRIKRFCVDNGIKIQSFIECALLTELELRGDNYDKKSTKRS